MTTRREALGWIVGGVASVALPGDGAKAKPERSALEGVAGLDAPVTFSEAKIPLGELVARIAAETGVALRAGKEVADEPVAILVDAIPARTLLEEFARLLDYQWSRRGREGHWRYEIWQDLAARQREEALGEPADHDLGFASEQPSSSLEVAVDALEVGREDEFTAEREAALAKDPVLGVVKQFKPKPESLFRFPGGQTAVRFPELRFELARLYGVQFISDAYWLEWPTLIMSVLPTGPAPFYEIWDALTVAHQRWERRGDLICLRSRLWFYDRPREIPLRYIRRWRKQLDAQAALSEAEYLTIAHELSDDQLETLRRPILGDMELPDEPFSHFHNARHALRLYTALLPADRQALLAGRTVPTARMIRAQRDFYLDAVRAFHTPGPWEPEPEKLAAGGVSVERTKAERRTARRPAVRAIEEEEVSANASKSSPSHPIVQLWFRFHYGEETHIAGGITLPAAE